MKLGGPSVLSDARFPSGHVQFRPVSAPSKIERNAVENEILGVRCPDAFFSEIERTIVKN